MMKSEILQSMSPNGYSNDSIEYGPEASDIPQKNLIDDQAQIPLLPLKNMAMLPKSIIPIIVGRDISLKAVEYALKHDKIVFVTAQKNADIEIPAIKDLFTYGTRATILQVMRIPNGSVKILVESICRSKATKIEERDGFLFANYKDLATSNTRHSVKLEALWRELKTFFLEYASLQDKVPSDIVQGVNTVEDIDFISDTISVHIANLTLLERQKLVQLNDLEKRLSFLCQLLSKEIEILKTELHIRGQVQSQVEKNQKEYYLQEQIKAIQKELGRDENISEIESLKSKAEKLSLSKEALEKVNKELSRLEQMSPYSSEAVVSRSYVDWVLSLPWIKVSTDKISLTKAIAMLNKHHAGLKKVKERIIEFLAAKKFSSNVKRSPVICLAGPPGVGKTSLARSIAETMGREFVRISLGGVRDEAEIRGHRRTYIGALPGKIIQAMKKAKTCNPVILLDEIDKMSHDMSGDPAAALLEVLDPEQNREFVDHYIDVEYDLSQVMFIATANVLEHIPYALYDRLEIISLPGYTEEEKITIAKNFLIPRNLKEYDLKKTQFNLPDESIMHIITQYTKESGVRQLERIIAKLMRKTIQELLHEEKKIKSITITPEYILQWLGYPTHKKTSLNPTEKRVGLAIGLAWTEIGGDVLEIETSALPGKGGVTLTGQLGEVMQESAQAAQSYIRSRAKELGLKASYHTSKDIHIHMPEGATPKDGPSAGITICTALISALTENPTKAHLAMTGEITLQGRVLAIGGLQEKLLAAKQHNCTDVIIPYENKDDIKELDRDLPHVTKGLNIIFVKKMDEVLEHAFEVHPFVKAKAIKKSTKAKKAIKKKKSTSKIQGAVKAI